MSTIYRVHWTPGTDRLLAICHCQAWCELNDPVDAWQWLLAHPDGHTHPDDSGRRGRTAPAGVPPVAEAVPAAVSPEAQP